MCSALAGALILGAARQARASDEEDILIGLAIGVVLMDVVFTGYDIGVAAKGEAADNTWLIAETAFTTPQTLLLLGAMPFIITEEREPAAVAMFVPTVMVGTMTAHGVTGLLRADEPAEHIGVSAALATNTTLTTAALTRTFQGELATTPMAAVGVSATLPQLIVGPLKIATDEEDRGLWIGLTAWAGGLFLHSLASLVLGGDSDDHSVAIPRVQIATTVVSDGVIKAPGLGMSGVF